MTTSLEQVREDQALGAAWRRLAELSGTDYISLEVRLLKRHGRVSRPLLQLIWNIPNRRDALKALERVAALMELLRAEE